MPTRSSAEHHSSNITFLINVLHIWSSDLRFLVHGVFRPPTDAPPNQPGSGDTLAKVLLAAVGLLEAGAPAGVRRAVMCMVGKLLGEEGEEVASARDGAGLEVAS